MPQIALLALAAVAVLMFKHAVADFYLQTAYQYLNKGTYGHPGGFIHAGIHVALTPLVYLVLVPGSLLIAGAIALGEFLLHYQSIGPRSRSRVAMAGRRRTPASGMRSAPIS